MAISKVEVQRILDRLGRLENQIGNMKFKVENIEKNMLPENLLRRVREGEADEKRKAEKGDIIADLFKKEGPG